MKVRAWLISQNVDGVGSRGVISRAAWAAVYRAATEDGVVFDDYDPAQPGKVLKASKTPAPATPTKTIDIRPTYRVKSLPKVRNNLTAFSYLEGSGKVVLGFDICSSCVQHVSRCPCEGGPKPPRFTTGELLWERPAV